MSDTIIQQWNQAAQSFTDGQECSSFAESNKTFVKQRFRKLNGEKVLDLGCGYGWYSDYSEVVAETWSGSTAQRQ